MTRDVEAPAAEAGNDKNTNDKSSGKEGGGGRRRSRSRGGRGRGRSRGSGGNASSDANGKKTEASEAPSNGDTSSNSNSGSSSRSGRGGRGSGRRGGSGRSSGGGGGNRRGGRRRGTRREGSEQRKSAGAAEVYREIIVNAESWQTRVAILEDGVLAEYMIERPEMRRIVGDVYKGKVTAILPGIQAAFLDIGLDKGAFLHVSDLSADLDSLDLDEEERKRNDANKRIPIEDQLKKGDELLVQVMKEPIGTKGPRVTAQVTLPGRFVVLMPGMDHVGVSRKIDERSERSRLRQIIQKHRPAGTGVITRTVGSGEPEESFANDIRYLQQTWERIQKESERQKAPALIHQDMNITTGLIRDIFSDEFERLVVDTESEYDKVLEYVESISPDLADRIELYEEDIPIFDAFEVEPELEKTLHRKVWMKKGGYLCIDEAEALIAIDINTGRFKGKSDQEETIFRCNLEAAREIPRQLRLRDIGGLVVIDFIDMASEENRAAVLEELRRNLKKDRARTKTFPVSELGLVEMTRQRVRPAMSSYSVIECPECAGSGSILSEQTLLAKVERIIARVGRNSLLPRIELRVHPDRADFLLEKGFDRIAVLENKFDIAVDVHDDLDLHYDDVFVSDDKGRDITSKFAN